MDNVRFKWIVSVDGFRFLEWINSNFLTKTTRNFENFSFALVNFSNAELISTERLRKNNVMSFGSRFECAFVFVQCTMYIASNQLAFIVVNVLSRLFDSDRCSYTVEEKRDRANTTMFFIHSAYTPSNGITHCVSIYCMCLLFEMNKANYF